MFKILQQEVQASFDRLVKDSDNLFKTDVDRDALWETYLNAFEDATERQEHNCNCCRQFIKNYANIVGIINGKVVSIWDFKTKATGFEHIIEEMNRIALSGKIVNRLVLDTQKLGTKSSRDGLITWDHFYIEAPKSLVHSSRMTTIDTILSQHRSNQQVLNRALEEISIDSVETVLELIAQNSLYKGIEYKNMLTEFLKAKREFDKATDKNVYTWTKSTTLPQAICSIRNTSIGTLLVDLTEGRDLDSAVGAFERMVAPTNYKRTTALVTKRMYDDAEKTIIELGYMDSLGRRFATPEDISVDNVIYVNRDTKQAMGIFDQLREEVEVNPKTLGKVEEVTIDQFLNDIVPTAKSVEVLVENNHLNNLVSLIAPINEDAPSLFKWDNPFSWSYVNALTDSLIKEQVKAAGGRVDGELRVSLSWYNYDDLDLHVTEPNGNKIYFSNKRSSTSGALDVDMNAGGRNSRTPVENIIWTDKSRMVEGKYVVQVNNFTKREASDIGFAVEIECQGQTSLFESDRSPSNGGTVTVVTFTYSKANGIQFDREVKSTVVSKEKWGLKTNKFQKVSMILNSPNYWNTNVGNKHTFFILEGTKNDEQARGFFNEFLNEKLEKNRRAFEMLGGRLKIEPSDRQLSGVGFSSTQRNSVVCRVEGKFKRTLKVNF